MADDAQTDADAYLHARRNLIHYLASQLPNHTTLLVTAEQVALIGEYFMLARFLQPSIMVIEDVDLIARVGRACRLNHGASGSWPGKPRRRYNDFAGRNGSGTAGTQPC